MTQICSKCGAAKASFEINCLECWAAAMHGPLLSQVPEPTDFGPDVNSIMYTVVDFADNVPHPDPIDFRLAALLKLAEQFRPLLHERGIKVPSCATTLPWSFKA